MNFKSFAGSLAKYYMEFLETDFKKRRIPKRRINGYRDNNNHLIGLDLKKYNSFQEKIRSLLKKGQIHTGSVLLSKGKYTTSLGGQASSLIAKQIDSIEESSIVSLIANFTYIINSNIDRYKDDAFEGISVCEDEITQSIKKDFIRPTIQNIESFIESQSTQDLESIFSIEENLVEILYELIQDKVSTIFNTLLLKQEVKVDKELSDAFDLLTIKNALLTYFEDLSIDDLYFDVQRLGNNIKIKDKSSLYLYIADVRYNNSKYPVFYIPVDLNKVGKKYELSFDSSIYINKKAISFVVDKVNEETNKSGKLDTINDRIIYLNNFDGNEILEELQVILNDITDHFELNQSIPIAGDLTKSNGLHISASNSLNLYIDDKSDEALINDYEELLNILKSDGQLSQFFTKLIENFITKNPVSIEAENEKQWEETPISDRLLPVCPIPMNTEQRQILNALRNNKSKYVLVDGPPGTGKSHSITAIAFQHILERKSILILSDKKEALDVVEDKLSSSMDTVRVGDNIQNPILRLGKTGNSYGKVLSTTGLNSLKQQYNAAKKHMSKLQADSRNSVKSLKNNIDSLIETNGKIKIKDLHAYAHLNQEYQIIQDYNLEEFMSQKNCKADVNSLVKNIIKLRDIMTSEDLNIEEKVEQYIQKESYHKGLIIFLSIISAIQKAKIESASEDISLLKKFNTQLLDDLKNDLLYFDELKSGIFGLLFKGSKVSDFNNRFRIKYDYDSIAKPSDNIETLSIVHSKMSELKTKLSNVNSKEDNIEIASKLLTFEKELIYQINPEPLLLMITEISKLASKYPENSKDFDIDPADVKTFYNNKLTEHDALGKTVIDHVSLEKDISTHFKNMPEFSFAAQSDHIQDLLAQKMTTTLDERVIKFSQESKSTMTTLRSVIRKKERFPKDSFEELKNAFPCIIAGIRDYAEYIPFDSDIFDLIIIDEASQVSIAQALPALFRGKKILVLGDKKQFSNVKSAQARSFTNATYMKNLEAEFQKNIGNDSAQLTRMSHFNIKSSILDFFEYVANCRITLLKHFRGYRENISYSSRYFYDNALQAIRLRTIPIEDVIRFTKVEHDGLIEPVPNTNKPEYDFILAGLNTLLKMSDPPSVGIISPFRNQVSFISQQLLKEQNVDEMYERLHLKIMTFDTCQGEERDYIFYSMVGHSGRDKLSSIFLKSFEGKDLEDGGVIRAQRLNVGFSRSKETMHFVHSKPLDEFNGTIRDALLHYQHQLSNAEKLPGIEDIDPNSPMEAKVLNWLQETQFFIDHIDDIEIKAQFPIGQYLKQIDPYYDHPAYKIDFLVIYNDENGKTVNVVIEYDGFEFHFVNYENVNEMNYEHFHNEDDVERQKILESYGYRFIRLNRFNTKNNPIEYLNNKLKDVVKKKFVENVVKQEIEESVLKQKSGQEKLCPGCKKLRPISSFESPKLKSGFGTKCSVCVPDRNAKKRKSTSSKKSSNYTTCPKCGSKMIKRRGKYTKWFWGCSRYPYCRGTRRL